MLPNFFNTCCTADQLFESEYEFSHSGSSSNIMPALFKNVHNPFKESQVSSFTQKLSIAKKLKQKKKQISFENQQNNKIFKQFEKHSDKISSQNQSTQFQHDESSIFTNFFKRKDSQKSLYEELISPRTLIESQVIERRAL